MTEQEIVERVRQMRERGNSPKQIARALGLRPSEVVPLVRQVAAVRQSQDDPADRALVGCWISPGWSVGLGLEGDAAGWAASDSLNDGDPVSGGLAKVLVARQERASRATVCGFLVDVYCLGVKDSIGPLSMGIGSIDAYRREFFRAFEASESPASVELAQHLIHGAVAYARSLGFEPADSFTAVAAYLGEPSAPTPIHFGHDGQPFYISGPYDNPRTVMSTLDSTVGAGNYQFMTHL